MADRDRQNASLEGIETKRLTEQVKRNLERFHGAWGVSPNATRIHVLSSRELAE